MRLAARLLAAISAATAITAAALAAGAPAPPAAWAPPQPQAATTIWTLAGDEALAASLPPLHEADLTAPHVAPPPLALRRRAPAPAAAQPVRHIRQRPLPVGLLLDSGGWFGPPLHAAAQTLAADTTPAQLRALEAVAATRPVNSRLLLALAAHTGAARTFSGRQAWLAWLAVTAARLRAPLGPFDPAETHLLPFADGSASIEPESGAAQLALLLCLGAGKTQAGAEAELAALLESYESAFGPPATPGPAGEAPAPFLQAPYRAPLTHRGYYDHTYPSVDSGGTPNVAGMQDYLGRSSTRYDTHDGDDFGVPYGTPVYAPVSGTVLWTADDAVLIGYAGSTYHIYIGHLSRLFVGQGDLIVGGETLLGLSGIAGGLAHIHVEVRHGGRQTDTMGWYGGGADPCPAGPGSSGRYLGCEASSWLWLDQAPPVSVTTEPQVYAPLLLLPESEPTPSGTPSATPSATPGTPTATPSATPADV